MQITACRVDILIVLQHHVQGDSGVIGDLHAEFAVSNSVHVGTVLAVPAQTEKLQKYAVLSTLRYRLGGIDLTLTSPMKILLQSGRMLVLTNANWNLHNTCIFNSVKVAMRTRNKFTRIRYGSRK